MIIGNSVFRIEKCKSSFDLAKNKIEELEDGTVFVTDFIENARGRGGREWVCYTGQLLLTILLKPQSLDSSEKLNQLIMIFSVAIIRILKKYNVGIKWPNDFVIGGKKLGGILGEVVWRNNKPQAFIVGIGINVNNVFCKSDKLYDIATSLKQEFGKQIDKDFLLNNILNEMDKLYFSFLKDSTFDIFGEWEQYQFYQGKNVKIHGYDGKIVNGVIEQFFANGDILLANEDGNKNRFSFYEILEIVI